MFSKHLTIIYFRIGSKLKVSSSFKSWWHCRTPGHVVKFINVVYFPGRSLPNVYDKEGGPYEKEVYGCSKFESEVQTRVYSEIVTLEKTGEPYFMDGGRRSNPLRIEEVRQSIKIYLKY